MTSRSFPNDLRAIALDADSLNKSLIHLRKAIAAAILYLSKEYARSNADRHDTPYTGASGLAAMYLRLVLQAEAVCLPFDQAVRCPSLVLNHLPPLSMPHVSPSHLSPLDSHAGAAILELTRQLCFPPNKSDLQGPPEEADQRRKTAMDIVISYIKVAVKEDNESSGGGGSEVLYGRAGLLWSLVNLRKLVDERAEQSKEWEKLRQSIRDEVLAHLVSMIIRAGKRGAASYENEYGQGSGLPLLWKWHDKFYLGAIHGVAGILTILLQLPAYLLGDNLAILLSCSSALLGLINTNSGDLPSSLPIRSRSSQLVQICHGSPGAILLLATIRSHHPDKYDRRWDLVEQRASERVWDVGLLKKGLGLCHGVSGNAWPWLLLASAPTISEHQSLASRLAMSRALAFLIHSADLPPLNLSGSIQHTYRLADHPESLFEGLAGAVCAWADACAVIMRGLKKEGQESEYPLPPILGLPGLGGVGVHGIL